MYALRTFAACVQPIMMIVADRAVAVAAVDTDLIQLALGHPAAGGEEVVQLDRKKKEQASDGNGKAFRVNTCILQKCATILLQYLNSAGLCTIKGNIGSIAATGTNQPAP